MIDRRRVFARVARDVLTPEVYDLIWAEAERRHPEHFIRTKKEAVVLVDNRPQYPRAGKSQG